MGDEYETITITRCIHSCCSLQSPPTASVHCSLDLPNVWCLLNVWSQPSYISMFSSYSEAFTICVICPAACTLISSHTFQRKALLGLDLDHFLSLSWVLFWLKILDILEDIGADGAKWIFQNNYLWWWWVILTKISTLVPNISFACDKYKFYSCKI